MIHSPVCILAHPAEVAETTSALSQLVMGNISARQPRARGTETAAAESTGFKIQCGLAHLEGSGAGSCMNALLFSHPFRLHCLFVGYCYMSSWRCTQVLCLSIGWHIKFWPLAADCIMQRAGWL